MRLYELVVILKTSLSEPQRKKLLDTIKSWLKEVKIVEEKAWGSKALRYKIKKELTGFYHSLQLSTEKMIPADFEKKLLENEMILRHLLMRKK